MSLNLFYAGVDVDEVRYHGSALDKYRGGVLDFHCRPTLKGLVGRLLKVHEYLGDVQLKLCYEASHLGFSLQRDLKGRVGFVELLSAGRR